MIKLICSDIDGTLLNAERQLSKKTIAEIGKLKDKLPVILISSRMPSAMKHLQKQLNIINHPIVAYNGGLIHINDDIKQSTTIPFEIVNKIIDLNEDCLHLSLYNNDNWFAPQLDHWTERETNNTKVNPTIKHNNEVLKHWKTHRKGAHKIMCMGDTKLVTKFYDLLSENFSNDIHLYRSKDTYIEIAPKQISKRSAIEFLIESEFGLNMSEVISFGDNFNDIEMLEASGLGVAVGNARKEVKHIADKTIENAKEDGVANFLNDYFKMS
ncbi:Cof-type HAD-IIB family hydrolase [Psychroflexus salinarum]|uniref:Cof-type HAD-IIB family hydrolase n=1 Tax=Psychroflexus salinarum TaxID=546024 RepID=A0ABW3GMH2_9FLAO